MPKTNAKMCQIKKNRGKSSTERSREFRARQKQLLINQNRCSNLSVNETDVINDHSQQRNNVLMGYNLGINNFTCFTKMVEVDPQLFVTCRLCLDVEGQLQINPSVQQQIKYCFDIEVEPFDGLPQLICKKCENILREHYAIKKNFTDKQKELKSKLQDNVRKVNGSPSPHDDSENHISEENVNNIFPARLDDSDSSSYKKIKRKKKKIKKKRIINRLMSSSSCDDSEPNGPSESTKIVNATHHSYNGDIKSWDANLNKYFVCRICSERFQDKENITKHIQRHSILNNKYKNVFKMSCLVVMKKIGNEPNLCNSNKAVVYSSDSIIENSHNPFYYIVYHPKNYSNIFNTFKFVSHKRSASNSESTDCDILTCKRSRLLSRSSSETVVLNRHSEHEDTSRDTKHNDNPPRVIDCIDLGDSSDNGSYGNNEKSNSLINKGKLDSKTTHNIVKMCHNKYTKQLDSLEKNPSQNDKGKEEFLQHKVLSIGRKIINNKGFNCTGLLRFLENKELSVIWKETSILNPSYDGKYVRIATRVRGNESIDVNNIGWKDFRLIQFDKTQDRSSSNILNKLRKFRNFKKLKENTVKNKEENTNSVEQLPQIYSVFSHTNLEIIKTDSENLLLQKLLNENPVSNPKQLPKKVNNCENNTKNMKVFSAPNTVPVVITKQTENNNEMDTNTMPIVTSTVSLAHLYDKDKTDPVGDSANTSNNQQTYPRIKVKPVSELMPEKSTGNISSNNTYPNGTQNASEVNVIWPSRAWPSQANTIVAISNPHTWPSQNQCPNVQPAWPNQTVPLNEQRNTASVDSASASESSRSSEFSKENILLDTVEFPNTKTTSPFQYFKNLLILHNIILLDADQPLPATSVSLIKLKVVYHQENCQSINLCLTLFGFENLFCIQIKDLNHKNVNMYDVSAHWQWQLLQIYNNDVIAKVLQSAKKVSQETLKYTNEFFALLKSIRVKNDLI